VCRRGPSAGVNTLLADLDFAASITLAASKSYLNSIARTKVPSKSSHELGRWLSKLDSLLRDHDTSAVDCVESLRPLLPPQTRDTMRKLDVRIRAYDFEGAREQLTELTRAIEANSGA